MLRQPLLWRKALSLFVLGFLTSVVAARSCYYPNGNLAEGDIPCGDEDASACCGSDAICLTNGLCIGLQQPYVLGRGSCTDDSWESSYCPNRCKAVNPGGGCSIVLFNSTSDSVEYCCNSIVVEPGNGLPVCASGQPFLIANGEMVPGKGALAQYVTISSENYSTSATATSSPTDSPIPEDSTTSTTVTSSSTDSPTSNDSTTSATETSSSTGSPSSQDSSTACDAVSITNSSSHDMVIGLGIGLPLGFLLVATASWAMWENCQRRKLRKHSMPASSTMMHNRNYDTASKAQTYSEDPRHELF